MKKLFFILLANALLIHISYSQSLLQQIENSYNALDSISYTESIVESYKEYLNLELIDAFNYMNMTPVQRQNALDSIMGKYNTRELSFREDLTKKKVLEEIDAKYGDAIANAYLNLDGSIQRQNTYDSIIIDFSKISMERRYSTFISAIKDKPIHYVLNLMLQDDQTLRVDTGKLAFNLFYFDENYKGSLYVYCKDGQYSGQDARYRTFSRQLSKNAPKVFKRIMRKNPQYLLYCSELEGMNTILYVLNDKIYIYRIIQMEEHELSDYLKIFK